MEHIAELFAQVVELKDPEARADFLQRKLGQQSPVLAEIQELLRVHEVATDFLETPSILLLDDLKDEVPGLIDSPISGLDEKLGTRIGKYTIHRRLGSGGMGTVYLGHDEELQRPVAIKFVSAHYASNANSKWLQRFEREAHSAATLNHPNILTVHEILRSEGVPCLVTEYVEGRTLRDLLLSGPLSLKLALSITRQLTRALAAAHERRVIHRDLKPENVMIRPDQLVKILDFGIARQLHLEGNDGADEKNANALTNPGQIQGTLWYMSPEQLRGGPVDARSDLFSLGCVIYEMLAGRPPFARSTSADSIAAVLHELPPDLRAEFPEVPVNLSQIVRRLLAGNPVDRYQSAQDVLQDVSQHFDAEEDDSTTNAADDKPAVVPGHTGNAQPASTDPQIPEVHYATSDEVSIAYQVFGSGPLDLIFVMGWVSHLDWFWKEPSFARFLRRLGDSFRVILFDKRGTGLSDRVPNDQLPTLEQRMDDVRAVMEAAGSDRAVLCGVSEGGPLCSLFAATYPDRTAALIMIGAYARRLRDEDYPWGPTEVEHGQFLEQIRRGWGGPVGIETRAPSRSSDPQFRRWWCDYLRMGASPGAAVALTRMNARVDVRPILSAIQVPALVIHRTGDMCLRVEEGRYLASQIPNARFVELWGADHLPFVGLQEEVLDAIEQFMANLESAVHVDRILATVLAVRFAHEANYSPQISIDLRRKTMDEFASFRCTRTQQDSECLMATFDGPVRALRAALNIRDMARRANEPLQIGLTVGECCLRPERVSGDAIDVATRITALATSNVILASATLRDLVPGSNIQFSPTTFRPELLPAGVPQLLEVIG